MVGTEYVFVFTGIDVLTNGVQDEEPRSLIFLDNEILGR